MNAVTDKTFSLLKRILKQCEELNIPYFLGFRTAAYSMLDELPDNISHFEIFMFQWDIARLLIKLKKWDDIRTESLQNYSGIPDLCTFVTCTSSTCIDLHHIGANSTYGCAVVITPISDKMPFSSYRRYYYWRRWQQIRNAFGWYTKPSIGTKRLIKKLNNVTKPEKVEAVYLWRWRYRDIKFEFSFFEKTELANLNGTNFCVPEKVENYCRNYYGSATLNNLSGPCSTNYVLRYADIPFVNVPVQSSFWMLANKAVDSILKRLIRKKMKYILQEKNYYFRTISRFEMQQQYYPIRETCREAYLKTDWDTLGRLLQPYLEETRKFFTRNIPFGFDMEFYVWLIHYLEHNNDAPNVLTYLINNKSEVEKYLDFVANYKE